MKTTGLIFGLLLASCTLGYSQRVKQKDIPLSIANAFKVKFPGIVAERWEKEETSFEAEFDKDGKEYEAAFDANGNWLETEHEMKFKQLPQLIKDGLAKSLYKDWEVEEAAEIESTEYKLAYEIEVERGKEKVSLYFSPEGNLIKEEK